MFLARFRSSARSKYLLRSRAPVKPHSLGAEGHVGLALAENQEGQLIIVDADEWVKGREKKQKKKQRRRRSRRRRGRRRNNTMYQAHAVP